RTSRVPGPPAAAGELVSAFRPAAVNAIGSCATDCAAPVTAPTTAPATMVSSTAPVFSSRVFTAGLRVCLALAFERDAPELEPARPDFIDADDLPPLVEDAEADFVGFGELLAFALALLCDAAGFRCELALGADPAVRESAEVRPLADDDEG